MGVSDQFISGRFPVSAKPVRKAEAGRVCAEEDCDSVLSVYNLGKLCSVHDLARYHRMRAVPKTDVAAIG